MNKFTIGLNNLYNHIAIDKKLLLFIFGNIFWQLSRFLGSFFAARFLSPEKFGIWNILNLVLIYGSLTNLGAINGMGREIPYWEGAGDFVKKKLSEKVGFSITLIGVTLFFLVATFLFFFFNVWNEYKLERYLILIVLIFQQLSTYCIFFLRSNREFISLSVMLIIMSCIHIISSVIGTYFYGLNGFILGQIPSHAISIVYLFFVRRQFQGWSLDKQMLARILNIGLPIMAAGFVFSLLSTIDRWVIINKLSNVDLGYYSIAILTFTGISVLPRIVSDQMYPEMAYLFGKSQKIESLREPFLRQTYISIFFSLPITLVVIVLLPFIVETFLPKYVNGIHAGQIMAIASLGISISGGAGNVLNTVGLQFVYLIAQIVCTLAIWLGANILVNVWGIEGVAISFSSVIFMYGLLLYSFVFWLIKRASKYRYK